MRTTEGMRNTEKISVTASNTLSKIDYITVEEGNYDSSTLKREWELQHFSAKQALDMAAEFAKSLYTLNLQKVLTSETDILKDIVYQAVKIFNVCEGWEEDEFEVVKDI